MTPKRRRLWLLLGSLSALGVAAALVLTALNDNLVFFYSPTQVAEKSIGPERRFRLGGLVETGSVRKSGDGVVVFTVTDNIAATQVQYHGDLPDLFREGQGIVAQGAFRPDRVFEASQVLAKHDETYMPREVADRLKEKGEWRPETGEAPPSQASRSL